MTGNDDTTIGGTTASSYGDTNVRYAIFTGKQEDWETWREKFMVKAGIGGFESILMGDDAVPPTHDKDGQKLTLSAADQTMSETRKDLEIWYFR